MPKSRWLSAAMVCLLAVNLLAACGGDSAPTTQPTNPEAATATPETAAPTTDSNLPVTTGNPLQLPYLQYGAAAQLYYTDRNRALTLMNNAGFDWVRQQIQWKDIEGPKGNFGWGELDAIVADANAKNIKVLLSIVRSPSWARADGTNGMPDNIKDFGDFVEALVVRYKGKVQAYEIWNEQNLDHENGGSRDSIDATKYVDLLVEAYNRIKPIDPEAFVISGALTSTGDSPAAIDDMTYFEQMFSYKDGIFKDHIDGVGFHPSPSYNPPATLWPDQPGPGPGWLESPTHYFRHIENLKILMDKYGMQDYQVWVTEFGWATQNTSPGYEYGNEISFEQQGQYVLDALQMTRRDYPWVATMFVWNLNFAVTSPDPLDQTASFGILNPDWSPRPVFEKIQGFVNAVKTEEGR
ncbi:MAG TPA: hypothetical protein DEF47_06195 [Herpetosiphon sp.]|uniref:Glycoside hydrolase family 5 domain-containing protein n=1 Tax=Herpetosiphon aurantiacus (strain ATCC 23779 / DSM 785 / 114-95) TaxID=316274 RepID=A9B2V7_HERA2|nr:cellulase family glycosylhydrolase [Herpetosiphon sp.]ABX06020.1 conserved hypothetical protein [Herpetosiphon aurantiacus DSM 785]HBW49474.1 hypothetical protein [Herpetosiphon sp.]